MKKYLIILLTILAFFKGYSQQRLEVKKMGFSIDVPKNWMSMENEAILKNLNNYEFTEKQLIELMRADNSSINLASYSKYDTKTYQGIIPTIKIRAIKDQTNNIKDFLILVQNSNETAKKAFDNFKFVEQPVIVHISNQQVVKVLVQFSIKNDGVAYKIISNSYYIPKKGYFISLNFIEEIGKEDNHLLFEDLVKSIILTK